MTESLEERLDSIKNLIGLIGLLLSFIAFIISMLSLYISGDIYKSTMIGSEFKFGIFTHFKDDEYNNEEVLFFPGDKFPNENELCIYDYYNVDTDTTNTLNIVIENLGKTPFKNIIIDIEFENILIFNVKENSDLKPLTSDNSFTKVLRWTSPSDKLFYPKFSDCIEFNLSDVGEFLMADTGGKMIIRVSGENCKFTEITIPVEWPKYKDPFDLSKTN